MYLNLSTEKTSVWHFVYCLVSGTWCLMLLAFLKTHLMDTQDAKDVYNTILEADKSMNTGEAETTNWSLVFVTGVFPWLAISMSVLMYMTGLKPLLCLYGYTTVLVFFEILRVALLKLVVAKRFKNIWFSAHDLEYVQQLIVNSQKVIDCNKEIQRKYLLLVTSFFVYIFQLFLYFCYSMWGIYGGGNKLPSIYEYHMVPACMCYGSMFFVPFLTAYCSKMVTDEVEQLKLNLDITMTPSPCTETQYRLIYLHLMELHHTPVQMSALGLFAIDCHTLSTACAVATSYLLVLIQYS